jgi:hypothetical protein
MAKLDFGPPSQCFGAAAFAFHFVQSASWWLGAELDASTFHKPLEINFLWHR